MPTFQCPEGIMPEIPNLSLPQFILDTEIPIRPRRGPEIPWLIEDSTGRKLGIDELRARTFGLANSLASRYKIREDDVVLVFSRNHIDYPVAIWAAHRLGAVVSGANPDYSSEELVYQIQVAKASLAFVHPEALEVARTAAQSADLLPERIILFNVGNPTSTHTSIEELVQEGLKLKPQFIEPKIDARTKLAFLSFSSGTTGKPKAVAIPHVAPIANVIQMAVHNKLSMNYAPWEEQRFRPGDTAVAVLPFYHIYGLVLNLHFILFAGMSIVIVPKFNFEGMLKSIVRHRITHLMLVPPQIILLCKHPAVKNYDLSIIRFVMSGAAPLSGEINSHLFQLLPNAQIGQAYGMTETSTVVSSWPVSQKRGTAGSGGQLIPGILARVVKPDGTLAGYDEPGELFIKTPSSALRYQNNEEATKETFIDGWIRTGDEVRIDRNAEIWVLDRLKEMLKVRGFQVAPAELEGCILDHPDVNDCCVVGVPDDYSGEIPMAFVVLSNDTLQRLKQSPSGAEEIKASIMKHVADNKIKYKHLSGGIEIVSSIPKNPSGKLLRRILRERARQIHHKVAAKL